LTLCARVPISTSLIDTVSHKRDCPTPKLFRASCELREPLCVPELCGEVVAAQLARRRAWQAACSSKRSFARPSTDDVDCLAIAHPLPVLGRI
jgi:hypothetical protein